MYLKKWVNVNNNEELCEKKNELYIIQKLHNYKLNNYVY